MIPQTDGQLEEKDQHLRTGFQAKYLSLPYRRLILDREVTEGDILRKNLDPPNHSPPDEKVTDTEKLNDLVENSQKPLIKIRTIIPLNPFPDEVVVDINKVNIIYRYFFFSSHIHSVYIKDVSDVVVETGLLFSTLKIVDVGFTENSVDIGYLSTKDAVRARKIIQGLVIAQKNGIDLAKYQLSDLSEQLEILGTATQKV